MNNRYICRGKRKDNGKWVEGYLIQGNKTYIATTEAINYMVVSTSYMASIELVEVIPKTVGQLRDERPANKVIALACKALEKQMSKKAIYGDDEQDFIRCPNCNYELAYVDDYYYEKYNYCPNCGQKIKWE